MPAAKTRALADRRRSRRKQAAETKQGIKVYCCKICLAETPATFSQEHHETPQAAGGTAGPTSELCAGCHHNLHRVADMLTRGKAGLAEDSVAIMYPDDQGAKERMFALARTVVEYMTMKADGKIDLDTPAKVMVLLPPKVKLAAQMIANDHRGPTGRKLGLATWISAMVKREVYERYPHLKPKPE